ncbi:MAG TPA: VOC family protein [Methanoregulaceae archaeon]|nr:VOC family protein [Methanoregulaceae archaeon]
MQKITPFLWFDYQAEEAVRYYISVFKNSKIVRTVRYGQAGPGPEAQ